MRTRMLHGMAGMRDYLNSEVGVYTMLNFMMLACVLYLGWAG